MIMQNDSAAIRLDGITKRFGRNTALENVSLGVPPGTVFALLGENGAGKTTAIRILLGLCDPDEGKASILQWNSRTDGVAIRRSVGYVPEESDLYDWMRVREIGRFAAGFHGEAFWKGYQTLIDDFRVPRDGKIRSLSKGMRAKVSLALALAHDPEVLILDEPTSGLDAIVRREFLESMVDRAAAGKTVFLSSHQINEVERVADYVGIIKKSTLLTVEKLDDLKKDTHSVTLALSDDTSDPPALPGTILECRVRGRQLTGIVRGVDEKSLLALKEHPVCEHVELHKPNLEEIFVAYMGTPEAG